jgi:hypothetical protein
VAEKLFKKRKRMKKLLPTALLALFLTVFQTSAQTTTGKWEYNTSTDPFNDAKREILVLKSNESDRTAFVFRCNNTELDIFILTSTFLNSKDPVSVIYRFDKNTISSSQKWEVTTSGTGAFLPQEFFQKFAQEALNAKVFVIRLTKYTGENVTYSFDWTGFDTASQKMSCLHQLTAKPDITVSSFYYDDVNNGYSKVESAFKNTSGHLLKSLKANITFYEEHGLALKDKQINLKPLAVDAVGDFYTRVKVEPFAYCELSFEDSSGKLVTRLP